MRVANRFRRSVFRVADTYGTRPLAVKDDHIDSDLGGH